MENKIKFIDKILGIFCFVLDKKVFFYVYWANYLTINSVIFEAKGSSIDATGSNITFVWM